MTVSTVSTTTAQTSTASSSTPATALQSLSSNFTDFLGMLTTQLQNQDPTNPMDTQSFTTELVQFSGVEQQVATNSSLTQLVQLTQAGQVVQGASMMGHTVAVNATQLPLQQGNASLSFTAASAGPVQVSVTNASGQTLYSQTVNASAGSNNWTWNGQTSAGTTMPDGAYNVAVTSATTNAAVPFVVNGVVTGVQNNSGTVSLALGPLTVGLSALSAMVN